MPPMLVKKGVNERLTRFWLQAQPTERSVQSKVPCPPCEITFGFSMFVLSRMRCHLPPKGVGVSRMNNGVVRKMLTHQTG